MTQKGVRNRGQCSSKCALPLAKMSLARTTDLQICKLPRISSSVVPSMWFHYQASSPEIRFFPECEPAGHKDPARTVKRSKGQREGPLRRGPCFRVVPFARCRRSPFAKPKEPKLDLLVRPECRPSLSLSLGLLQLGTVTLMCPSFFRNPKNNTKITPTPIAMPISVPIPFLCCQSRNQRPESLLKIDPLCKENHF